MDEKKIGRPKEMDNAKPVTFKLPAELYDSLKDYASSCGQKVSDVLREYVEDLVVTHKQKIAAFRRQKDKRVKAFATPSKPETPTKKSARATKKKSAAQMDAVPETVTSDGDEFAPNTAAGAINRQNKGQTITVEVSKIESLPTVAQITVLGGSDAVEEKKVGDGDETA